MILEKSLIHDFVRIKFKVVIIKKPAWYEINIYAVTDLETAFFLKVNIYTGKYT